MIYFIFSENVDVAEAKALFESSYSAVYSVFYDQFINIEANLRQRGENYFSIYFPCASSDDMNNLRY